MLPATLLAVLGNLRYVFTAPGFATFTVLATGLIANTGVGTVTGMLTGAGLARTWPHHRAHGFFAHAAWSSDTLGLYLSRLIARTLLPDGAALTVLDDTLFKKRGRKVFGAAWQHDGAARSQKPVGYGCCFVVAGIIVELPFLTRPVGAGTGPRLQRETDDRTALSPGQDRSVQARQRASLQFPGRAPPNRSSPEPLDSRPSHPRVPPCGLTGEDE
jgi:hypothetical protein